MVLIITSYFHSETKENAKMMVPSADSRETRCILIIITTLLVGRNIIIVISVVIIMYFSELPFVKKK